MTAPLIGYADRISVRAGQKIAFKVSSTAPGPYNASLIRIVRGDPNPDGPGVKFEDHSEHFDGRFPSRQQHSWPGSYALIEGAATARLPASLSVEALIWPTLPGDPAQTVISRRDPASGDGFALVMTPEGMMLEVSNVKVSVGRPLRPHLGNPRPQGGVVRINRQREAGIAFRIFMAAAHQRIARQGLQLGETREHLRRRAFDQPPAAQAEQRIAGQEHRPLRKEEIDLAARMAGRVDHLTSGIAQRHRIALPHRDIQLRQPVRIRRRANHRAGEARPHLVRRRDMVAMVMRQQDHIQPPARRLDRRDDGRALGRIDDRRCARLTVFQEPRIIVIQNGHGLRGDCHVLDPSRYRREPAFVI